MKRLVKTLPVIFCLSITMGNLKAQVGIGTIDPDTSVILDVRSPSKGVLLPRVVDLNSASKREGSLIYDSIAGKIKCYYNSQWLNINPLTTDVNGNVTAPGNLTVHDNLKIRGAIDSSATVNQDLKINNALTAKSLNVQNNAAITGSQTIGGDLSVTGKITAGSFSGNGSLISAVDAATLGGSPKSYFAPEDSITNIKNRLNGKVSFTVSPPYATIAWNESSYQKIGKLVLVNVRFCCRATTNNRYLYIYVAGLPNYLPTSSTSINAAYIGTTIINPPSSPDGGNCGSIHLTYFTPGNNGSIYLYAYIADGSNFSPTTNIIDLQFYYFCYSSNM